MIYLSCFVHLINFTLGQDSIWENSATLTECSHQYTKHLYHHSLLLAVTAGSYSTSNEGLTLIFKKSEIPHYIIMIFIYYILPLYYILCLLIMLFDRSSSYDYDARVKYIGYLRHWTSMPKILHFSCVINTFEDWALHSFCRRKFIYTHRKSYT